jgi:hypothetical protein
MEKIVNGNVSCSGHSDYLVVALSGIYRVTDIYDLVVSPLSNINARFYVATASGTAATNQIKLDMSALSVNSLNLIQPLELPADKDLRIAANNTTEINIYYGLKGFN